MIHEIRTHVMKIQIRANANKTIYICEKEPSNALIL